MPATSVAKQDIGQENAQGSKQTTTKDVTPQEDEGVAEIATKDEVARHQANLGEDE